MTDNPWLRTTRPLVISHRGQALELPENTLEAFTRAIEFGAEMIESDVNLTRDGHVVMIHDWMLDRTTSGSGRVRDATLDEIRNLDAGSWFGHEFTGLRVPTVEETLELAREAGIMMDFEVKGANEAEARLIAESLATLFVRHDALDWAVLSSYFHDALAHAKTCVPELIVAPERLPDDLPANPAEALRQANALDAPILQIDVQFLTADLADHLHRGGVALWPWPTTDEQSILDSLDAGVDGLMGDDVRAMVRALEQRDGSAAT
jgi:glycerophosphoryl diester phosphodiesterase